jgi:hypothetical protein
VGPVLVIELLELPERVQQVCTQRSMIEFIFGIWTPLSTVSIPASLARRRTGRELSVPVPDQETRPAPGILKIHNEVPRGLPDPGRSGMRGRA